jgi:2-methylcitrate dehydratase PrpD
VRKAEDLLVDWFGSAVAGHGSRPVESITRFAMPWGRRLARLRHAHSGPERVLITRRAWSSPYLAAMANAAASHVAEQDDVHNGSVFHPATVVFPAAVAVAQAIGASGRQLLTASVAGYEVGIRVGEFLGRSHYKVFHTTGTAGTLAAAAAVGNLLGLDAGQMQHAFGSAGTQSAGLWEFLRTAADSKQLHTAHAAAAGLMAAYLAQGRLHRRGGDLRRRPGHGRRHVQRRQPAKLTEAGHGAGRRPRPRSSTTPPAATRTPPPMRCCT